MNKNGLYKELERWLVQFKKNSIKASSYNTTMSTLKLLGRYSISEIEPENITTDDIQKLMNALVNDRYSMETITKVYKLIGEYLDYCLYLGRITRAVHKGVRRPSESTVLKKKRNIVAYNEDEQAILYKVLESSSNPCYQAALLMLETGMRVGEVMALCWSDIDWRRRSVHINKTTIRCKQRQADYIQHQPKTMSSIRTIALSSRAQALLRKVIGDTNIGFIFHDEDDEPLRYDCMKYWIRKACEEANVTYYGQHVFRHTFATNCYYKGCDVKLLSRMLGHANVTTTYNMYIHLYGDALEDMRAIVE